MSKSQDKKDLASDVDDIVRVVMAQISGLDLDMGLHVLASITGQVIATKVRGDVAKVSRAAHAMKPMIETAAFAKIVYDNSQRQKGPG